MLFIVSAFYRQESLALPKQLLNSQHPKDELQISIEKTIFRLRIDLYSLEAIVFGLIIKHS